MSKVTETTNIWLERKGIQIPDELTAVVGGHRLVAQALVQRGMQDISTAKAFLDPAHYVPAGPEQLPGLAEAVDLLQGAIQRGETICVWGDFDVDGQTATTLLVSALEGLGAGVIYHIPVRARESHGVGVPALKLILEGALGERPSVLLTCDTGISAHDAVAYAQHNGMTVIITDHHDLPPSLPEADAIINPKLLPAGHPLGSLPGVGVAYKLMEAMYANAGRPAEIESQLDLAALGIVADLAVLAGDTRNLLQHGLERLRKAGRPGLRAMLELVELDASRLTEEHIGFILAPRLNAIGRLSDANPIVEFLTTPDMGRARILSLEMEGLNARRKLLTDQVSQAALAQLERDPALSESTVLVLAHPEWPAGVLGIVASRLVERTHKPVVLLSCPPGESARGSARSVEGVDITAAIRVQKELLAGFGGHPMAAGLSIEPQRIPEFRSALSRSVADLMGAMPPHPLLYIDGYLELSELSLELVRDLERLAPFGPGNPALILASRRLRAASTSPVGREGDHLLVTVEDDSGDTHRVIWWGGGGEAVPEGLFDLAYSVRSSSYRGQAEIQIEWVDAQAVEEPMAEISTWQSPEEIIDFRKEDNPLAELGAWLDHPGVQVWAEGLQAEQAIGTNRLELVEGDTLVIWTIPPGPEEMLAALHIVKPKSVVLFATNPVMNGFESYIKRVAGLIKYALASSQGRVSMQSLAAATSQRLATTRAALAWLQAAGHIQIVHLEGDTAWLTQGEGKPGAELPEAAQRLKAALEETAAYRAFYIRADIRALLPDQ